MLPVCWLETLQYLGPRDRQQHLLEGISSEAVHDFGKSKGSIWIG